MTNFSDLTVSCGKPEGLGLPIKTQVSFASHRRHAQLRFRVSGVWGLGLRGKTVLNVPKLQTLTLPKP